MTIEIQSIDENNDSFGQWLAKTNYLINAVNAYAVTVNSNTAVGNASITATFTANTMYAVSNVFIGNTASNSYIDGQFIKIQNSTTSNAIISYDGMLLSGVTQYTTDFMTMGNTSITGHSVTSNDATFDDVYVLNYINANNINANTANVNYLSVTGGADPVAWVGTNESNVYINKFGLQISNNPLGTYTVNSYMNWLELNITDVVSNTVDAYQVSCTDLEALNVISPIVFKANTEFQGSNNQFRNGLAANGSVSLVGSGVHFSHQWYDDDPYLSNTAYLFTTAAGVASFSRNWYRAAGARPTSQVGVINSNTANRIALGQLSDGMQFMEYQEFYEGVPGTDTYLTRNIFRSTVDYSRFYQGNVIFAANNSDDVSSRNLAEYGKIVLEGTLAFYPTEALQGVVGIRANTITNEWTMTLPSSPGNPTDQLTTDGNGNTYWMERFSIKPTDNLRFNSLGLGTPASGLTGEIRAVNNITAYYSSDKNLKENVQPIKNALNKVENINGVEFDWKDSYIEQRGGEDGFFVRKHDVGVIAQELEQVLPEVVVTRDDGFKAVNYEKVVALLIQAIKELKEEVDSLKANK